MLPIVTLVGRPNVGKSMLFNYLTNTHDAIVANVPRLTRDRKYGKVTVKKYEFSIIDTSGIDGTESGIEIQMAKQTISSIEEAHLVLFIVDGHDGLIPADLYIANLLRSSYKKTIFLIVNKSDGIYPELTKTDFFLLGFTEIYAVSASNGYGIKKFLKNGLLPWIEKNYIKINQFYSSSLLIKDDDHKRTKIIKSNLIKLPIKLAIIGRPNVGKSTLINCILGEKRVVVYKSPGTTRDNLYIPMEHKKCKYILIDTAGICKRKKKSDLIEEFSVKKTFQAIKDANVVIFLMDANIGVVDQDLSILNLILNHGHSLVLAFNKWDFISKNMRHKIKDMLKFRLNFINYIHVHFISALYSNGIENLFSSVIEVYNYSTKRINPSKLTNIMNKAVKHHQPSLVYGGRSIKFKYAHIGGYNPLIIVIHGKHIRYLSNSYKLYLINYFRRSLNIIGSIIRIQLKDKSYKDKKTT